MVFNLDERVSLLENTFSKFVTFSNELFFDGQIWDAHSLLLDIFNSSNKSIVIIDNYISKELLDVVCKTYKTAHKNTYLFFISFILAYFFKKYYIYLQLCGKMYSYIFRLEVNYGFT